MWDWQYYGLLDDRAPVAVLGLITLIVDLSERVKMLIDQTPQVGGARIAWLVQRERLDTRYSHEKNGMEECILRHLADPGRTKGQTVRDQYVRPSRSREQCRQKRLIEPTI